MHGLHGLLAASAEHDPNKALFIAKGSSHTYAEVYDRAARLASTLRSMGVGRGDRVVVVLDGTVDYLVAFYASLMAGAAAVPLCPDTRTGPLVYALANVEARAVVLDAANLRWLDGQAGALPALRAVIVRGAGVLERPGHLSTVSLDDALTGAAFADSGMHDNDLATVMYTSGTTGKPKGVMLSHGNWVSNVRSVVEYLSLRADDTVGMVLPFYYVYGNSVLHTHVAVGGTIASVGTLTFVAQVVENLARFQCTGISGVPATFARLLSFTSFEKYDLSRLRYMTQAGAAMMPQLIDKLRHTFPRTEIFVMYGQTEASARLSYLPPERLDEKLGSAGKAIPGVTLKVCDPEGNELPRGELGEVVAQGPNIMLAYFGDPDATARALRPEGLRTGDYATMDDEGYLYIKGRKSELIKSGGHRISPLEIEGVVSRVAGVRACAAVGVPDDMMGEAIALYLVAEPGATLSKRTVLDGCFNELPKFKMPSLLYVVEELPHGQTGKILRTELRVWHAEGRGQKLT